ncbi:GGDEF domain-containing protein [Exilibacterium tricleocarpae]|uniref:diguanylate cyclase n=2 Tax=Exilibacterium tricleocarpae TaxID=2591008 RepID=A0A545TV01_9GAMM|nr:GGDEF domain-containing protein [Exilibacterium tricleocarpae]
MKDRETIPLVCPVGESHCAFLDELARLRQQNRELAEQVRTDTLTGVFNYRHLIQSLEQEIERTRRSAQPTTLIMLDLDHFKLVNDTWGHDTGNAALVNATAAIRGAVRKLDVPCRYGGEEFAVVLPSTSLLMGIQVAERLRNTIVNSPLRIDDQVIRLTASFGVDVFAPGDTETPEAFLKRTDQYLYQAKQNGRNRVCHAIDARLNTGTSISQAERDALLGGDDETDS